MTPEEMEAAANANMSNYGGDDFVNYTGAGDDFVDFGGIEYTFATEINKGRLYTMSLTNSATLTRTARLCPGLVYVKGSEANGQVKTGAFNDTSGAAGLSGSGSPGSIEKFIAYVRSNPTLFAGFKIKSTIASQIDQTISISRETPFSNTNEEPKEIFLQAFADENSYNDKIVTVPDPFQFDPETIFDLPVVASATTSITFFGGASLNTSKGLMKKAARARVNIARVGAGAVRKKALIMANKGRALGMK